MKSIMLPPLPLGTEITIKVSWMGDPLPQGGLVLSVEHIAEGSIIIPMGQEMVIAPQSPNMMILGIRPNADSPIMVEPNKV